MARRRLHSGSSDAGELNLVPYMDIVVNLILFLMLSSTSFVPFGVVDVSAPSPILDASHKDPPLALTVAISPHGFVVSENGDETTLAKTGAAYDYRALTARIAGVKRAHPKETAVVLTASEDTTYEVLVATMDATRHDEHDGELFPNVVLRPKSP